MLGKWHNGEQIETEFSIDLEEPDEENEESKEENVEGG